MCYFSENIIYNTVATCKYLDKLTTYTPLESKVHKAHLNPGLKRNVHFSLPTSDRSVSSQCFQLLALSQIVFRLH